MRVPTSIAGVTTTAVTFDRSVPGPLLRMTEGVAGITQEAIALGAIYVRLRFINPSQTIHPMHLHGTMAIVAKDGETLAAPQRINTVTLDPGETYDVVFRADNPGRWVLHCHDLHHASNDGVEPGGLVLEVRVGAETVPVAPAIAPSPARPTPMPSRMPGMGH